MMKPLILLSVNNSWNILNFRSALVRSIQDAGFEIGVLTPDDAHAPRLADLGVTHYPVPIDSKGLDPIADLRLLARYAKLFRTLRPSAFLAWTIKPNIYGSLAARMCGVPAINNVSGLGTAFIRRGPLTALVSVLYRLAFSQSATVFFQNPDDRRLFVTEDLVASDRAALLPGSGIDTDRFAPSPVQRPDGGPFRFLLVARLLRDKGILEYVEAARVLRAAGSDARFELLGFLDVDNRTAIDRQELGSWVDEGLIDYLGAADDVRPHIAAADCVVLPSYREGMPRSLLEGAAMGKPLIASRVPGCVEIAREGENALLCTVRDPASFAEAMRAMMALPDARRSEMAATGRRIAVGEFDQRIVIERYMTALRTALSTDR